VRALSSFNGFLFNDAFKKDDPRVAENDIDNHYKVSK
jgi:hypothetical protein